MTRSSRIGIASIGAFVLVAGVGCSSGSSGGSGGSTSGTGTVTIGINESLTGDFSSFSIPPADGAQLAIKEINDAGGITVGGKHYQLKATVLDTQSTPATSVANMRKLINDDHVKFVFGPTYSALANQTADIAKGQQVLQISPAGSWQADGYAVGDSNPYVFSTQNDTAQTSTIRAAMLAAADPSHGSLGILSYDDATTAGNLPPVKAALAKVGFKDVHTVLIPPTATDFTPYVTKLKNQGVKSIFLLNPNNLIGPVYQAAAQVNAGPLGVFTSFSGPYATLGSYLGKPLPMPWGSAYATPSLDVPPNDQVAKLREDVMAFDPKMPQSLLNSVFWSYDFIKMLAKAMETANSVTDVPAIANALHGLHYEGVAGPICWKKDARVPEMNGSFLIIKKGTTVENGKTPSPDSLISQTVPADTTLC